AVEEGQRGYPADGRFGDISAFKGEGIEHAFRGKDQFVVIRRGGRDRVSVCVEIDHEHFWRIFAARSVIGEQREAVAARGIAALYAIQRAAARRSADEFAAGRRLHAAEFDRGWIFRRRIDIFYGRIVNLIKYRSASVRSRGDRGRAVSAEADICLLRIV